MTTCKAGGFSRSNELATSLPLGFFVGSIELSRAKAPESVTFDVISLKLGL
jgi:hypothetical protein